jgi:hypothetical protein
MRNVTGIGILIGLTVIAACGKKSDTAAGAAADSASAAVAAPPPPPAPSASDAAPPPSDAAPADAAASAAPPPSPALAAAHPAYLHALSDLRLARFYLFRHPGDRAQRWDEHIAIRHTEAAIREITYAAISDGKNIDDHPAADTAGDFGGRLHRALDALRAAKAACAKQEDNGSIRGMRDRAIRNIDMAIAATEEGVMDWGRPPPPGAVVAPPGRPLPPGRPVRPPPPR